MDDLINKTKECLSKSVSDTIEQMYTLGYMAGVNDASKNIQAAQLKAAAKAASMMLSMQSDINEFMKEVTEDE